MTPKPLLPGAALRAPATPALPRRRSAAQDPAAS